MRIICSTAFLPICCKENCAGGKINPITGTDLRVMVNEFVYCYQCKNCHRLRFYCGICADGDKTTLLATDAMYGDRTMLVPYFIQHLYRSHLLRNGIASYGYTMKTYGVSKEGRYECVYLDIANLANHCSQLFFIRHADVDEYSSIIVEGAKDNVDSAEEHEKLSTRHDDFNFDNFHEWFIKTLSLSNYKCVNCKMRYEGLPSVEIVFKHIHECIE